MAIDTKKKSNGNGLSHLGVGTVFSGKLVVPHELSINGEFSGEIECGSEVTIGIKSVVKANIKAKSIIIGGHVEGDINCDDYVELEEKSTLIGNITAKQLIINKGATFHGNSNMNKNKEV